MHGRPPYWATTTIAPRYMFMGHAKANSPDLGAVTSRRPAHSGEACGGRDRLGRSRRPRRSSRLAGEAQGDLFAGLDLDALGLESFLRHGDLRYSGSAGLPRRRCLLSAGKDEEKGQESADAHVRTCDPTPYLPQCFVQGRGGCLRRIPDAGPSVPHWVDEGETRAMNDLEIRQRDRHALREGYGPAVRRFEIASILAYALAMAWL